MNEPAESGGSGQSSLGPEGHVSSLLLFCQRAMLVTARLLEIAAVPINHSVHPSIDGWRERARASQKRA